MLNFEKLDLNRHDLEGVATLIYHTDLGFFSFLFGSHLPQAIGRITQFIKAPNNPFSQEYLYVVTEEQKLVGILVAYSQEEYRQDNELRLFLQNWSFPQLLKLALAFPAVNYFLTLKLPPKTFYLSNISVHPASRGQGVGTFILKNAKQLAQEKGCRQMMLDVSLENPRGEKLYSRFGFEVAKNRQLLPGLALGTRQMVYQLA